MRLEEAFGQVLQELRQERGLSQEQLGFQRGYHRTYISLLERGRKSPTLRAVFELSRALTIPARALVHRIEARLAQTRGDARGGIGGEAERRE